MDITQLQTVLGLASGALGATGQAVSTVDAIKKLFAKEGGQTPAEVQALLNSLANELTAANLMNVKLSDALKELHKILQREDAFERERERYEVFHTSKDDIVLRLRSDARNGEKERYICPICANTKQIISYVTGDRYYKNCQTCNHLFDFEEQPMPERDSPDFY